MTVEMRCEYRGSLLEHQGHWFKVEKDPDFHGRYRLTAWDSDGERVILRNVRAQSINFENSFHIEDFR